MKVLIATVIALSSGVTSYRNNNYRDRWICTATVTDDSGLFYLGIGHSYAEAYSKAQEACSRSRHTCITTCEVD